MDILNEKCESVLRAILDLAKYQSPHWEIFQEGFAAIPDATDLSQSDILTYIHKLKDDGYLKPMRGPWNPYPYVAFVLPKALTYFDDKESYLSRQNSAPMQQVFNIGSADRSIIGSQQQANINTDSSVQIFKSKISSADESDKVTLEKLAHLLEKYEKGAEEPKKGALAQFFEVLSKYSWAVESVTKVLLAWIAQS